MCCNANKCCCGCVSMKTGITVAGIIDLLILLAAAAAIAVVIGYHGGLLFMIYIANSNYIFVMVVLIAWFGILVTSDILLIVGLCAPFYRSQVNLGSDSWVWMSVHP